MVFIENILRKKIVSFSLIIILIILCLGFFNSNWYSLILFQLMFLLMYSAKIETSIKKWTIVIFFIPILLLIKKNLDLPKITEGSNVFIGGEKYKNSIFKNNLPDKIFKKLNSDYEEIFKESISGPDNKFYYKSVSQMLHKHPETRVVENINWENRYQLQLGAFNNTKYNAYGNQQPSRNNLPFFVKYSFPDKYSKSNAKFCWRGLGYVGNDLKKIEFEKINCIDFKSIKINPNKNYNIWLIETGKKNNLKAKLVLPIKYKIMFYLKHFITIFAAIFLLILLFKNVNIKKSFLFLSSFLISFIFKIYFYPNFLNKFIIFEGGNDGLLYVHFAHMITEYISSGDLKNAFMGGEEAYDLMPFYRYIWPINYLLFDESPWILMIILTFFPLVIYNIFKETLNEKWAKYFLIFWFIIM